MRLSSYQIAFASLVQGIILLIIAQSLAVLYGPFGSTQHSMMSKPTICNRFFLPSSARTIRNQEWGIGYSSITYTSEEKPTGAFQIKAFGIPFPAVCSLSYGPNRVGNVHPELREFGVTQFHEVPLPPSVVALLRASNATLPTSIHWQWMIVNLLSYWTVSMLIILICRASQRVWRIRHRRCPSCGYQLIELRRCPECGSIGNVKHTC